MSTHINWPHIDHREAMERSRKSIDESLAALRLPTWPRDYFPPYENAVDPPINRVDEELEREWARVEPTLQTPLTYLD